MSFFAPVIFPRPIIVSISLGLLLIVLLFAATKHRSRSLLFSVLSLLFLVCLLLSIPRAANRLPGFYFSASRLILTLPIAVWVIIFLFNYKENLFLQNNINKQKKILPYLALTLITVISFTTTQLSFKKTMSDATVLDLSSLASPVALEAECQAVSDLYRETGAQLFATNDANVAYACAALHKNLRTLYPAYDRRGWIIKEAYELPLSRILIQDIDCVQPIPNGIKCTRMNSNTVLVDTKPTNASSTLFILGVPVKLSTPPSY